MKENRLRAVIIGLGYIAKNIMLPILLTSKSAREQIEVIGICAKTEKSMNQVAAQYNVKKLYQDVESIRSDEIDIAFVLTPKQTHFAIVESLLEKGIDVFCEKPIATNLQQSRDLVRRADKMNRILMIGFNRRYAPAIQRAKAEYLNEAPDICFVEKNRPGTEYRATLENAIHMVDLLRFFCGEAKNVQAKAQYDDPYYETSATAQIAFENGAIGMLVANRSAGQWVEKVELDGQGKTVMVDFPERTTIQYKDHEEVFTLTPMAMGWAQAFDRLGFNAEIDHFIECVLERRVPITSGQEAVKTLELMNAILTEAGLPNLDARDIK
jgi:virulence factor